ncbi:hypothetical protein HYH03_006588 [Edaphochlamys debaryana]|uniref:Peptidase M11 gametolysin domain-containing protein n=1 Tax=Edaphochlamys debaryana TaxID=47281 RepID=A0A835Y2I0_9CHLO|nr:hypothetical protein HYH03_006588 [Edaphochlamys debaryana]|eukprot:KAG2495317.1 hypothetical protein HYH03_006588 [Edaphochlamys debaryana]
MARQGLSSAVLFFLLLGVALAETSFKGHTPPPRRRPPPTRRPPPRAPSKSVPVTVQVKGELALASSHEEPIRNPETEEAVWDIKPDYDLIHRLVDNTVNTSDPSQIVYDTRIEVPPTAAPAITGDIIDSNLTYLVPAEVAKALGLEPDPTSTGPAEAPEGSGGRRRRLSEEQASVRRMILEYHGTRRTLQQVNTLASLIQRLDATGTFNAVPRAAFDAPTQNSAPKDLFVPPDGTPQQVSSLTFLFQSSACGVVPRVTLDEVRNRWFDNGDSAPVVATLQRYHRTCSFNKLRMSTPDNLVFGPIDVPCTGSQPTKGAYDLKTKCGDPELYGLWDLAKEWLRKNNLTVFNLAPSIRRKVLIFPFNLANCQWAGLGSVGCPGTGDCLAWLNPLVTETTLNTPTIFHELAHNIGLAHSARIKCDAAGCVKDGYGDPSDPMGSAGPKSVNTQFVCMSAPQGYKAGWISPFKDGELARLVPDMQKSITFVLPAMATTDKSFLRLELLQTGINVGDRLKPRRALYISYRYRTTTPGGYDSGLSDNYNGRVWVHEYNETANQLSAIQSTPPVVLGMLDNAIVKDSKTNKWGPPIVSGWGALPKMMTLGPDQLGSGLTDNLRIIVIEKTNASATIALCRFRGVIPTAETGDEACNDELDNDCDGLTDDKDPDCQGQTEAASPPPPPLVTIRKSPPPSPRPPPPPRPSSPPPPKRSPSPPPRSSSPPPPSRKPRARPWAPKARR